MASNNDVEKIDFDESFELVDGTKITDCEEDEKMEGFLLVPTMADVIKEVKEVEVEHKEDITVAIVGKWKPISTDNLDDYFNTQKLSDLSELAWRHGIVCYEMRGNHLHVHTELLSKKLNASISELGRRVNRGDGSVVFRVENNCLNTISTKISDGSEVWRVDRWIEDGKLIIVNSIGESKCKRVYERVN